MQKGWALLEHAIIAISEAALWLRRGWDVLGWLRRDPYAGTARYATANGVAGSAADDVREHWTRRHVGPTPKNAFAPSMLMGKGG